MPVPGRLAVRMPVAALGPALALLALAAPSVADGWSAYGNARFGYAVEVPPGFTPISEAENGDGGTARSAQGHALLAVWGSNLLDETFASNAAARIASATGEGWTIGYKAIGRGGASWAGTRGDRIVYARGVPRCADQVAYLEIEYDAAAKAAFDPIVARLARSLKAGGRC